MMAGSRCGQWLKAVPLNLGKMARLVVAGVDIIVASNRSQTFDIGPFAALGIDVNDYRIIALKSSNHFRAGFRDVATHIVTADTPGLTTHQIQVFHDETKPIPYGRWMKKSSIRYEQ
jgi:microcystin degradation protein MlrC